jgi:beta-lactamase class A
MRSILFTLLLALTLPLFSCATMASKVGITPLARRLDRYLHPPGGTIGVSYMNLETGVTFTHDDDAVFHAASTVKVPLMMGLFQAIDDKQLRLDQPIAIRNQFPSLIDGSNFTLDPKGDGDPDLYQAIGSTRTVEELIRRMIVRSSNLATNLLIEQIGASRVRDLMLSLNAYRTQVLRGVEDDKAYQAGINNITTAGDLATLLGALVKGDAFKPASTARMLEILKAQEFNEKIPAGLPAGTVVAHKTGDITGTHHDAAIVFPPGVKPYILVVLTEGYPDEASADHAIAEISRVVWEQRADLPLARPGKDKEKTDEKEHRSGEAEHRDG